jgi:hypothetical protein
VTGELGALCVVLLAAGACWGGVGSRSLPAGDTAALQGGGRAGWGGDLLVVA